MVNAAADYAIYALDAHGNVQSWNLGAERIEGYRADEIIGQHVSRLYPEEATRAGDPDRELELSAEAGQFAECGWRVRKDGGRFWADVAMTPMHHTGGQLVGFACVMREVRRDEHFVHHAEASPVAGRMIRIFRNVSGGGLVLDTVAWIALTGQTPSEVHWLGWLQAVHPEDRFLVGTRLANGLARKWDFEARFRLRQADGRYCAFLLRTAALSESGGQAMEWVGALTEIGPLSRVG